LFSPVYNEYVTYSGLTTDKAEQLLKQFGLNEIPEKKASFSRKILKNIISPISIMLIVASVLSFSLGKTFDGHFILILLVINLAITLWQEQKADNAIAELNKNLEQENTALRNNKWQNIKSKYIVPGDVIRLTPGEIIPADAKVIKTDNLLVNESVITGESLSKEKKSGDTLYSGSYIADGIVIAKITATGTKTSFGKTITSVERLRKQSLLEKDILTISKFLTVLSLISAAILTVTFIAQKADLKDLITLDLSLVIAGIPVSLPTVMTLIVEFGVVALAKKKAIVRRLSALDDLANVDFLLTDKTGTLTENKIKVQDVLTYENYQLQDVILFAALAVDPDSKNPIDTAINEKTREMNIETSGYKRIKFTPANPDSKHSTSEIEFDNKDIIISLGAPQIVANFCILSGSAEKKFQDDINRLASKGYRSLAVAKATGDKESEMQMIGLIAISDTLRSDAKDVISFLKEGGIGVSIVTGDNSAITTQIVHQLALTGKVTTKKDLDTTDWENIDAEFYRNTPAFSEVLPSDKLTLVEKAKKYFIVACNGDGINDLPAVKAANVGIAVKNALPALKAAADIVLLSDGISIIKDAIIESRKIFERIYTYSLYRISESFRLIITIALLGIFYGYYPLTALQIIVLVLLNDIPIISLAFNRVHIANKPNKIDSKARFTLSTLFGLAGVANSLLLFVLTKNIFNFDWPTIQTMFFLKLTVSGHLLIYVAHTKLRWWKYLPSKEVILATSITQATATALALSGFLMPGKITLLQAAFVWIWSFIWMQISEGAKTIQNR
jgi:H+-transporting ATPase